MNMVVTSQAGLGARSTKREGSNLYSKWAEVVGLQIDIARLKRSATFYVGNSR